jgi:hypothetical protein
VLDGPEGSLGPALPVYPTCRRGIHELSPDNLGAAGRCQACKREYQHARRRGLPWDGPIVRHVAGTRSRWPLNPARLRLLRLAVGACPECGWTPEHIGRHACVEEVTEG